jgi:hypothetical protein
VRSQLETSEYPRGTDSRHTVFLDRMKPQARAKYAHSCTRSTAWGLNALLYQPLLSLVNTATRINNRVVMFIYQFDIKNVNANPNRRPLGSVPTAVSEFATAQISESDCIHPRTPVREITSWSSDSVSARDKHDFHSERERRKRCFLSGMEGGADLRCMVGQYPFCKKRLLLWFA